MQIFLAIVVILFAWIAWYQLLSRIMFRSRLKRWERMEDMMNEGNQTSIILLISGICGLFSAPFFMEAGSFLFVFVQ
ncbi:hypothetical protein V8J88_21405 [Massilia sp. W12]|uniref:hypothetical protein n=1 Tax=Massilia sp. W12 TaxID=3126507 RepID=UPI0030CB9956